MTSPDPSGSEQSHSEPDPAPSPDAGAWPDEGSGVFAPEPYERADFVPDTQTLLWMWTTGLPEETIARFRDHFANRIHQLVETSGTAVSSDDERWVELVYELDELFKWNLAHAARERGAGPSGPAQQ